MEAHRDARTELDHGAVLEGDGALTCEDDEHLVDLEVRSLVTSPPTLEEIFMRHYGDGTAVPGPATQLVT